MIEIRHSIKRYDGESIEFKIIVLGPFSPLKYLHINDFGLIFKGRRKNVPARESNPGSLVYETSALTIEPREFVAYF